MTILLYYARRRRAVLFVYLRSGRAGLNLRWAKPEWRLFKNILSVGLLSAFGTLQSNLTVVLVTGAVGVFGIDALAGYGTASRLDYIMIPLMFGLGTALVTMVGTNVGAGQVARARRIAWTGAIFAALVLEAIGIFVAFLPQAWIGIFTNRAGGAGDRRALSARGRPVLRLHRPCSVDLLRQPGTGTILLPILAGTLRLLIAAVLGWVAVTRFNVGLARALCLSGCVLGRLCGGECGCSPAPRMGPGRSLKFFLPRLLRRKIAVPNSKSARAVTDARRRRRFRPVQLCPLRVRRMSLAWRICNAFLRSLTPLPLHRRLRPTFLAARPGDRR